MNRRLLAAALLSAALLAIPATAAAQSAPSIGSAAVAGAPGAAAKPKPHKPHKPLKPKKAVVKITDIGNLSAGRARILTKVPVSGTISPFVPGQHVEMTYYFNGNKLLTRSVKVQKRDGAGFFKSSVAIKKGGKYAVSAKHVATKKQKGDSTIRKSWKVSYPKLRPGHCGRLYGAFRQALNKLGYVPGGGHCFNGKMGRAILAFRKVNGLSRNEHAGKRIVQQVFSGQGGYKVAHPGAGEHIEAPLSKQIIAFSKGDKVFAVYPISSGKPSTPTVRGHFNFYLTQPGYNSEGMYYSFYFIGGYAIHGYESVPNYPASHGCLRTFIADQPEIFNKIFYGEDIFVW